LGGQKEVSFKKSLLFMSGKENMMTHGDPYRMKVIASKEVSFTIVVLEKE